MGRFSPATGQDAEREIALLAELSHRDLAARWYGRAWCATAQGDEPLLLLALAYQLQADAYGALDSKTNRYLRAVAAGNPGAVRPLPALKPGMRLMREWNGHTHVVDVTEDGLLWSDVTCCSVPGAPVSRRCSAPWAGRSTALGAFSPPRSKRYKA